MDILFGVGLTIYSIGIIFGVFFFCLHIGLESSKLPFALRFSVALMAAILWPLGFGLYGPLMGWKSSHDQRSFEKESARRNAERVAGGEGGFDSSRA